MSDVVIEAHHERVLLLTLNRPEALNALNAELLQALESALRRTDADAGVGCVVITGSDKAFAAGADIKEMLARDAAQMYLQDWFAGWDRVANTRKPTIAAVAGYALGGGCELAMMCDIILAADNAKFAQPEIKLGVLPGMGGTQRLTRLVGRAKAMDLCLTGRTIDATEADRIGLVSRVVPTGKLLDEALSLAAAIAGMSLPAAMMVKESVKYAEEASLSNGVRFERRLFHASFAFEDQDEGMAAFVNKRVAQFKHR